jgi:hypothetical protein
MLALLLKHMLSCIDAADIVQLVRDIPDQPPVVIPVRTVQEAVAAGDLPPLDADAANVFSRSEHILQDHVRKHNTNAAELKDLIQCFCNMISYVISCMIYRCREEKRMLEQQKAMHTITMLARSAWMCIFSSQPFQGNQMSFVQMTASWRGKSGLSIRFTNPIRLSAGCLQNLQHGLVSILGTSCGYPPSGTWSGLQGS